MTLDSLSDGQIDALLTGSASLDADLEGIADALSAVQGFAMPDPDADFSHLFLAAAQESKLTLVELYARDELRDARIWKTRLARQVAMAAAALFVLVTMSSGLAYAANGAKPGDLLYGLDLALEGIGIGDGGVEERLAEIAVIAAPVEPSSFATANTDDAGAGLQGPEPSDGPREGLVPDDQAGGSPGGEGGSTASIDAGQANDPGPDESDEPTTTGEEATDDPADSTEAGDETTDDARDADDPADPIDDGELAEDADPSVEPPGDVPPPENPAADERLQKVVAELQGIVDDNPGSPLADKVEDATAKAATALQELRKTPPDGQAAAGNIEGAIGDLEAAVADGLLDPGHGNRLINQLAAIIRQIAA